jgi:hypothetical protein
VVGAHGVGWIWRRRSQIEGLGASRGRRSGVAASFLAGHGGGGEGEAVEGVVLFLFLAGPGGEGVLQRRVLLLFCVLMLVLFVPMRSSSPASPGGHGGGKV